MIYVNSFPHFISHTFFVSHLLPAWFYACGQPIAGTINRTTFNKSTAEPPHNSSISAIPHLQSKC